MTAFISYSMSRRRLLVLETMDTSMKDVQDPILVLASRDSSILGPYSGGYTRADERK
jgi:hypothetical protein